MAIERTWEIIGPIAFGVDGGSNGLVTVSTTVCSFKVKQVVVISSLTQPNLRLQIKRVVSPTQLIVGPIKDKTHPQKPINNLLSRTDISAYTVADVAQIHAPEQPKVRLDPRDIQQATYEQEPTLAWRTFPVDCLGRGYTADNPFPVTIEDIDISIEEANLHVQLTRKDDDPNLGDIHDATRIGNQTQEWDFKPTCVTGKGEGRVVDTLHCGGNDKIITVTNAPVEIKVSGSAKADRKTLFGQPLEKGVYISFRSNVTPDQTPTGGRPLGKNQPFEIDVEANTPVYLVGPIAGAKVYIGEA